jgi:hypothetical protein
MSPGVSLGAITKRQGEAHDVPSGTSVRAQRQRDAGADSTVLCARQRRPRRQQVARCRASWHHCDHDEHALEYDQTPFHGFPVLSRCQRHVTPARHQSAQ